MYSISNSVVNISNSVISISACEDTPCGCDIEPLDHLAKRIICLPLPGEEDPGEIYSIEPLDHTAEPLTDLPPEIEFYIPGQLGDGFDSIREKARIHFREVDGKLIYVISGSDKTIRANRLLASQGFKWSRNSYCWVCSDPDTLLRYMIRDD